MDDNQFLQAVLPVAKSGLGVSSGLAKMRPFQIGENGTLPDW